MPVHHLQSKIDLFALHQTNPESYPFLLEKSSADSLSRYSILFAFPGKSLRVEYHSDIHFTTAFDRWFKQEQSPLFIDTHLPFTGGWFMYLGYELAEQVEPVLDLPIDSFKLPTAIATRVKSAVICDHKTGECWFVTEDESDENLLIIQQDIDKIQQGSSKQSASKIINTTLNSNLIEDAPEKYLQGVGDISEYIKAGDVFQVNLSRAWQGELDDGVTSADLYKRLRLSNPAPFSALVNYADFSIISSSPERLVSVNNGIVEARPIAGTRPRGKNEANDKALLEELINHPKERAEHIMLIDLVRNDLGRISTAGSVEVDELMVVETYEHVHHIVSNIKGILKPQITPGDVINAVFPGGTITGCPKVRCMEIIAELEKIGRGPYTGSVGYINHSGDMDLNILIRTMVLKGNQLNFRTGAGIVYDSIPENEVEETRHKAKGLLKVFSA